MIVVVNFSLLLLAQNSFITFSLFEPISWGFNIAMILSVLVLLSRYAKRKQPPS